MVKFTFYDFIDNAILSSYWFDTASISILVILLFNWICTFYARAERADWIEKNLAAFTYIIVYSVYFVFIYMHYRNKSVLAFDYARIITTDLKYLIIVNLYFPIKRILLRLEIFTLRKEFISFVLLFLIVLGCLTVENSIGNKLQLLIIQHFFDGKGVKPISNAGVDVGFLYLYYNLTAAFIFAGTNSLINSFLSRQHKKILDKEIVLNEVKTQLLKTQLESLNAKVNPHFLYNTLNSIAALTTIDPVKSKAMLMLLSKLFRHNVNREEEIFSSLGDELDMVSAYLEIEKIRHEGNLQFELKMNTMLSNVKIPRFLLQPLIENAIKHGLNSTHPLTIIVAIFMQNNELVIQVIDDGTAFKTNFIPAYGFKSINDKLNLLYKGKYEVTIEKSPKKMVEIKITQP